MTPRKVLIGALALMLVAGAGVAARAVFASSPYEVSLVFPAAPNVLKGEKVEVGGFAAGTIKTVRAKDGQAIVTVSLEEKYAPLHDGTRAGIEWKALLGERIVNITPGKPSAPSLPSGALVRGSDDRVELDEVLAALDPTTRTHLTSLVRQLNSVVSGHTKQANDTIAAAGPTVEALGAVLRGVGADGPAIHDLVTRLNTMMGELDKRRGSLSTTVSSLTRQQQQIATHQADLRLTLQELPGTLAQAQTTLDQVPGTVRTTGPLLKKVATATEKLPEVSQQLSPVLTDLVPTLQQLRPTVSDLSKVLAGTPNLLDTASLLLPQASSTLTALRPALTYLRPYTPEAVGFLSNWGSAGAPFDNQTHAARVKVQQGSTSPIGTLTSLPPGITQQNRQPGENANQTWTDAQGDTLR
jgi:phospholipid/cholesterol/gamma-HCH transport system substrate-binding protein